MEMPPLPGPTQTVFGVTVGVTVMATLVLLMLIGMVAVQPLAPVTVTE